MIMQLQKISQGHDPLANKQGSGLHVGMRQIQLKLIKVTGNIGFEFNV